MAIIDRQSASPLMPEQAAKPMSISDKPFGSTSASDYPTAEAYCNACLINENTGPASRWTKGACKLPVRDPQGNLNRNAIHAAAAVLAGARGGVDASPSAKRSAASKLARLYAQLKETLPDAVRRMSQP